MYTLEKTQPRPTRDQLYTDMAILVSQRTTCLRRAVGCVLVNAKGHVLATGYNGVAAGQKHCNERTKHPVYANDPKVYYDAREDAFVFEGKVTQALNIMHKDQCVGFRIKHDQACPGHDSPSGTNLDACQAIHAEQNALLQCKDIYDIETCYCTASPCMTCTKLLLNTSCKRIVFFSEYPAPGAKDLWISSGREWIPYSKPEDI